MIHIIAGRLLAKNNVSSSQSRDKGNTGRTARVVETAKNRVGQRKSPSTVFVEDKTSRNGATLGGGLGKRANNGTKMAAALQRWRIKGSPENKMSRPIKYISAQPKDWWALRPQAQREGGTFYYLEVPKPPIGTKKESRTTKKHSIGCAIANQKRIVTARRI
jgi:hypothetical protein